MTARAPEAGVTLIEMLAALAVSAMIGVASFTLLDGVATRDAQLSGRIDDIAARDRAFRLVRRDLSMALNATLSDEAELKLSLPEFAVTWSGGEGGLIRKITWPDGQAMTQVVLTEEARIAAHSDSPRAITLALPGIDARMIAVLP